MWGSGLRASAAKIPPLDRSARACWKEERERENNFFSFCPNKFASSSSPPKYLHIFTLGQLHSRYWNGSPKGENVFHEKYLSVCRTLKQRYFLLFRKYAIFKGRKSKNGNEPFLLRLLRRQQKCLLSRLAKR